MNMVFDTPNDNGLTLEVGQNAAQVSVQLCAQSFVSQKGTAIFG
jgi:hypothetical protein